MNISMIVEMFGILLFFIGIFGLLTRDSILKSILSLIIAEMGSIIYFLGIHYKIEQDAPMVSLTKGPVADPLPQAMMITAIVIGVAVTAISITLLILVNRKFKTNSWKELKTLRIKEDQK